MKVRTFLLRSCLALLACAPAVTAPANASPWAEVGDNQLRSDIELLAAAGLIDGVTTHWPLPWRSLAKALHNVNLDEQPAAVSAAARRVLGRADGSLGVKVALFADATNLPSVVYGFDGMGRGKGEAQISLEDSGDVFSGRISIGGFAQDFHKNQLKLMPEGTYFSADIADTLVYAGYLDHWWGPGQISALSLSNNARPMPQVGIERSSTEASSLPVLNLFGPWQLEFFLAYMDGPRIQPDTYYNGLRFTFNPLPGLEVGIARTEMFCGQGHPCSPLRDYFDFQNDPGHVDKTNDEGEFDIKYSNVTAGIPWQAYIQVMNEDSSPIITSGSSHLIGASVWLPTGRNPFKLTAEYTDSISTRDIFSFGDDIYGFSYTNGTYPDGMRYRGRTLGFSLDDDSTLLSLQGNWSDDEGRFYEISLHHATIGSAHSLGANIISPVPVHVNMADARFSLPIRLGSSDGIKLDLDGRLQDDQPRPHQGFAAAIEAAIRIGL